MCPHCGHKYYVNTYKLYLFRYRRRKCLQIVRHHFTHRESVRMNIVALHFFRLCQSMCVWNYVEKRMNKVRPTQDVAALH